MYLVHNHVMIIIRPLVMGVHLVVPYSHRIPASKGLMEHPSATIQKQSG